MHQTSSGVRLDISIYSWFTVQTRNVEQIGIHGSNSDVRIHCRMLIRTRVLMETRINPLASIV